MKKLLIFAFGVGTGYLTMMPNVMVGASGKDYVSKLAQLGFSASIIMCIGGIMGLPKIIMIGFALQIIMLLLLTQNTP